MSTKNEFSFNAYHHSGNGTLIKPRCNDNSMEILEVTSGKVKLQIGTALTEAEAGDFVFVPPSMVFCAETVEGKATVRGLIFAKSILEANMENIDVDILYMFYVQSKNKLSVFKKDHPVCPILKRYMQDAQDEHIAKEVCYKLPMRANIYLMMTALLRYYCDSKDERDKISYHNVLRLRPAIEYINDNYNMKMYIEQLSAMIAVSPDYFTKMFRESMGKTPVDYINAIRVNTAMRLLCESAKSMNEIADEVGFCNSNYFHKIFKQYMDTSPLVYRKNAKN